MKCTRYIVILIFIYIICSARTCNENGETSEKEKEEYTINLLNSIKGVFSSDSLSENLLRAFEATAVDRLIDFTDYIKIVSDTSLENRFRSHTADLVKKMFLGDNIELRTWSNIYTHPDLITLDQFISFCLEKGFSSWVKPINIYVSKSFHMINDSVFTGNLLFTYEQIPFNQQTNFQQKYGNIIIEIFLVKDLRSFGDTPIKIWSIYLGNFKPPVGDN